MDFHLSVSDFRFPISDFRNFDFRLSPFPNPKNMTLKFPLELFFCAGLLVQISACSQAAKHLNPEQKPFIFKPGMVISHVTSLHDSTVSYALYLPKSYDPALSYPLIIAFDPHAAGKLPVDLFREEAERFGYIVAGSYNSKNGVALDINASVYDVMRRDILHRLSIDSTRIYTAGFSGGSRVASFTAISQGGISGVIGCSAGFPQIDKPITSRFSYLGIVGNADFNYSEMKALDKALEEARFVHHLLVFDGTHAWPPASIIPSIFNWLELDAMRRKLKPADANYISRVKDKYQKETDSLHRNNNITGEYSACIEASQFLNGVNDISSFMIRAKQLSNTPEVKKQIEEDDWLTKKETQLQQYYTQAIGPQSEDWWRAEVKRLNGPESNNIVMTERTMYKRVLSYLSLAAYMQANGALKAGDLEKAGYFIRVYAIVDTTNPEAPYLEAGWFAEQGKDYEALKSLSKAINLGFTDIKRLESDPAFARINGSPGYESALNRMRDEK